MHFSIFFSELAAISNAIDLLLTYVILNEVKNLKVSETVDGSANLEILRMRSG